MNPVAPAPDPDYQARQDAEHLNLLSSFYYVMTGLTALTGLIFIFHIIMGLVIVSGNFGPSANITLTPSTFPGAPSFPAGGASAQAGPPSAFGWIFVFMGALALILAETLALFTFLAGRSLARRDNKTLIQVVAALLCLHVPVGTALGVFTFIVLGRPSVAALFEAPRSS